MTKKQKTIFKFLLAIGLGLFFSLLAPQAFAVTNKNYLRGAYNSRENKFFLVWTDGRNSAEGVNCYDTAGCNPDIYGSFLNTNLVLGPEIPLAIQTKEQSYAEVVYNSRRNEYLVVFNQKDDHAFNIYGLRINNQGQVLATIPITAETNDQDQWEPAVAYDNLNDRYLIVWMGIDRGQDWGKDIRAQLLSGEGVKIGQIQYLSRDENANRAIGNQERPVAVFLPEEQKYLVVWEDEERGGKGTVLNINADIVISPKNFFFTQNTGRIVYPQLSYSRYNRQITVIWQEGISESINKKIKAQRLTADGQKTGSLIILDENTSSGQKYQNPRPGIAADPRNGSSLAGWHNWREYKSKLQFIDRNGQKTGGEITGLGSRPTILFNSEDRYFLIVKADDPTQFKTVLALPALAETPAAPSATPIPQPTSSENPPASGNTLNLKVKFSGLTEDEEILTDLRVKNKTFRRPLVVKNNGEQKNIPLSGLQTGTTYEFSLSAFPFLKIKKTLEIKDGANPSSGSLDFGTLKTGDLNNDNQINGLDWSFMKNNFGEEGVN